jgi:hypothetical protein
MSDWEHLVMDTSCPGVRRYWTGEGWTPEPAHAFRTIHDADAWDQYNYLVQNHCSAALIRMWWSRDILCVGSTFRTVSVVHRILVIESVIYLV